MFIKISSCPEFWKDVKHLHKVTKSQRYSPEVEYETFKQLDSHAKVETIPAIRAIATLIVNSTKEKLLDSISDKYDKQPYLTLGWEVRKMRFATDSTGKRGGLRIIFCVDNQCANVLLVLVKRKNECANERDLQNDFFQQNIPIHKLIMVNRPLVQNTSVTALLYFEYQLTRFSDAVKPFIIEKTKINP